MWRHLKPHQIESLDGKSKVIITAFTAEKVIGALRAVDWSTFSRKWPCLQKLEFPKLGPRPTVDILIGLDFTDLHYSFRDVRGAQGQPVARLTPLYFLQINRTCEKLT